MRKPQINQRRTDSMHRKSNEELEFIEKSGSLSSAAAHYEILRRAKKSA